MSTKAEPLTAEEIAKMRRSYNAREGVQPERERWLATIDERDRRIAELRRPTVAECPSLFGRIFGHKMKQFTVKVSFPPLRRGGLIEGIDAPACEAARSAISAPAQGRPN